MTQEEMIARIKLLGGEYDPNSNLSIDDQLWICESLKDEVAKVKEKDKLEELFIQTNT